MTAPVSQVLSEADGPREIWLSPVCDERSHYGEGRTWADPAPDYACECDEGGHLWVKYIRADLVNVESAALAFVRRVSEMVGDELDAHASTELRDAARAALAKEQGR